MPPNGPVVPWFDALYLGAVGCYGLHVLAALHAGLRAEDASRDRARADGASMARVLLWAGLILHLAGLAMRAWTIGFFPLTNKLESFYAFSFAAFVVTLFVQRSPSLVHRLGLPAVGLGFYGASFAFDRAAFYPPPLMRTLWYPLHVPASFLAYALWTSAAAIAVAILTGARSKRLLRMLDSHVFYGWCVFSVSMLFGGAWGYVAWGAYFLWDPKVVWSVILWLFFSGVVHLRYWPSAHRPRSRALLALVGFGIQLVAYVGTSFLFQHGSHSWR